MRDWFTLHSVIYRLVLGALVLAVVIPVWTSGHQPMWPVALITVSVVAPNFSGDTAPLSLPQAAAPRGTL